MTTTLFWLCLAIVVYAYSGDGTERTPVVGFVSGGTFTPDVDASYRK